MVQQFSSQLGASPKPTLTTWGEKHHVSGSKAGSDVALISSCAWIIVWFSTRCWDIIENTDVFWWIIKTPILASILVSLLTYVSRLHQSKSNCPSERKHPFELWPVRPGCIIAHFELHVVYYLVFTFPFPFILTILLCLSSRSWSNCSTFLKYAYLLS